MKELNTNMKDKIDWRRNKVFELSTKGFSQAEIATILKISEPTISRDISILKQEATKNIENHIKERLPYEYNRCISGLDEIIKESWLIASKAEGKGDNREKLSSLSLIKDAYTTKMDLLTNASLLNDAVKFVEHNNSNDKTSSSINSRENKKEENKLIDIQRSEEDNSIKSEERSTFNNTF